MTKVKSYKDLQVYQRCYQLSLDIHKFSLELPKHEHYAMGDQMRRASKSICANIAEGFAKQSEYPMEYSRFLVMALGSAQEMVVWCQYCFDLDYVKEKLWSEWNTEYEEIIKMLRALQKNWKIKNSKLPIS